MITRALKFDSWAAQVALDFRDLRAVMEGFVLGEHNRNGATWKCRISAKFVFPLDPAQLGENSCFFNW